MQMSHNALFVNMTEGQYICQIRKEGHNMDTFKLRETDEFIRLGQALKAAGLVDTGSEAKIVVQEGEVLVNGEVDTRRGKKLYDGDEFTFRGKTVRVEK